MQARRIRNWLLAVVWVGACASSKAYQVPPPPPPPLHGGGAPVYVPGELPPHQFSPRPISRRAHPEIVAASFSELPALQLSNKCVPAGAVPEGKPKPAVTVAKATVNRKQAKAKAKGASASKPAGYVPYAGNAAEADEGEAKAAAAAEAPADGSRTFETTVARAPASEPEPSPDPASMADEDADWGGGDAPVSATDSVDIAVAKSSDSRKRDRKAKKQSRQSAREEKRWQKRNERSNAPLAAEATPVSPAGDVALAQGQPEGQEEEVVALEPEWPPVEEGWGEATYLSNDDTMSLSSAQRVISAIDRFEPIVPSDIRSHELLNYFSFRTEPVQEGHDFSVHAEIAPSRRDPGMYTLAMAVNGRPVGRDGRRNAVVTLVVDRSGSMAAEGRMEYLKRGLLRMVRELKRGDVVHLVTFDHRVCTPLKNFVFGRDDSQKLIRAIHDIKPSGATNLHAGLTQGYTLADNSYQPKYTNRVIVVTDALANRGVTDPKTMAMVSDFFDARRIRLSGIGVGREFNDQLLDGLTEKGRGAYVYLGSEAEVDAVFGSHFVSLIETTANDTHFRLHLPPSLRIEQFHGEESSTRKADVQAVHFFADTSQLFVADLQAWQGRLREQDDVMLEIEYLHPETGEQMVEEYAFNLGEITGQADNVHKAEVIMHFIDGVQRQAFRGTPSRWDARAGGWADAGAVQECGRRRSELAELAAGQRDAEVSRVVGLWDSYCERFEGRPTGRPGRKDGWPSAQ